MAVASEADEVVGGDAEVEAAAAAADVDRVVQLARLVDDGRQQLALAERADPAEHVAGDPLGDGRVAHLDALAPERGANRLQRQLAADRHDGHGWLAVGGHEQRLEHLVGVEPERRRRLEAEARAPPGRARTRARVNATPAASRRGRRGSRAASNAGAPHWPMRLAVEPSLRTEDYPFTPPHPRALRRDRRDGHRPPQPLPPVPRGGPRRVPPPHRPPVPGAAGGRARRRRARGVRAVPPAAALRRRRSTSTSCWRRRPARRSRWPTC